MPDHHILLPECFATLWLKAMRSGDYLHSRGAMYRYNVITKQEKYSPMGILQHVVSGSVEKEKCSGLSRAFPSYDWLQDNNIKFLGRHGKAFKNPYIFEQACYLSDLNDFYQFSMLELSNLIEDEIQTIEKPYS